MLCHIGYSNKALPPLPWKAPAATRKDYSSACSRTALKVLLVNGKHTRNVKGCKTDVLDCQWIQWLHSLGLLSGSFPPDHDTAVLRQYVRQRDYLIEQQAAYIKKMEQALRQMNIRLDAAISDIVGQSGRAILEAILAGECNAAILATLVDRREGGKS